MTIITKNGQEKKENESNKAKAAANSDSQALLQVVDGVGAEGPGVDGPRAAWGVDEERPFFALEISGAWRRRRLLSSLCAGLLVLWLLLASVVGGLLLFRYIHRRPVFYGWCGTQYTEEGFGRSRFEKLQERVQVDPDEEYEKIEVPKFGPNRPAVFVHDFRQNLTAIVDVLGHQCFLKPLDREHVSPPDNFIDLISKMESGYYEQNTAVVRERYSVQFPPLTESEVAEAGSWMIRDQCEGLLTFRLRRTHDVLDEPQIDDPVLDDPFDPANQAARQKRSAAVSSFRYFSGKELVILDIKD